MPLDNFSSDIAEALTFTKIPCEIPGTQYKIIDN